MRILFGHQSVGQNILDGIGELARQGRTVPQVIDARAEGETRCPIVLAHFRIGVNGRPLSKLDHFAEEVTGQAGGQARAAMFKFCYVDLCQTDAVAAVFDAYVKTIDRLRLARPDLLIAHVTVPLRSVPPPVVSAGLRLLGRTHPQFAQNDARQRFNARLRDRYAATAPFFDLAALESGGQGAAPALARCFTDDGGHLNGRGRLQVAAAFVEFLQDLARSAP